MNRSVVLLAFLLSSCGELDGADAPPIASADDHNCHHDDHCVERVIVWIDGLPDDVSINYVPGQPITPACGFVDYAPSCWFTCGPSYSQRLSIDWVCGNTLFHEIIEPPFSTLIELDGCEAGDESSSGSSDSSSGTTEAHATDSAESTTT